MPEAAMSETAKTSYPAVPSKAAAKMAAAAPHFNKVIGSGHDASAFGWKHRRVSCLRRESQQCERGTDASH